VSYPRRILVAWLLLFVLVPATRAADPPGMGIGNQMTHMFDTMLNHTAPTAHLGQRRGVLTGGSVNARNRIMNESLWHFVPPSFDAGCGGIDLFAGSFSFISAEQFQNLLRAIAANATGYAFEVALGAMCKECLETMETLQKKIQALNQGFANYRIDHRVHLGVEPMNFPVRALDAHDLFPLSLAALEHRRNGGVDLWSVVDVDPLQPLGPLVDIADTMGQCEQGAGRAVGVANVAMTVD